MSLLKLAPPILGNVHKQWIEQFVLKTWSFKIKFVCCELQVISVPAELRI